LEGGGESVLVGAWAWKDGESDGGAEEDEEHEIEESGVGRGGIAGVGGEDSLLLCRFGVVDIAETLSPCKRGCGASSEEEAGENPGSGRSKGIAHG